MPDTYGPVNVYRWKLHHQLGHYLHVFLDGEDITTSCFFADDVAGIVHVYVRNAEGRITIDPETHSARWAERAGTVQIIAEPTRLPESL